MVLVFFVRLEWRFAPYYTLKKSVIQKCNKSVMGLMY